MAANLPGGGGGSGSKKKSSAPKAPTPATSKDVTKSSLRGLARYIKTSTYKYQTESDPVVRKTLKGLSPKEVRVAGNVAELPKPLVKYFAGVARTLREEERSGAGINPGVTSAGNFVLQQASRPVQTVESAVGEWSRQGEANPTQIGPLSLRFNVTDPGKILTAAKEGFQLKRHDTPVSIAQEAGVQRVAQGAGTKSFGVVPGTNLAKGEALPGGTPGKIIYDVGGAVALDPLTILTFGVGSAAKQGLIATERILGAERAAQVAAQGEKILSAEEKVRLGRDVVQRLRGIRGGVAVSRPQPIRAVREGKRLLAPPRTVIPGKALGSGILKKGLEAAGRTKVGSIIDGLFIPRSEILQAEREGRLPVGTARRVETMQATARGTSATGHTQDIALFRKLAEDAKLSREEALQVAVALDTGAPEILGERLRGVFDQLDEFRRGRSETLRQADLLPEEGKVDAQGQPLGIEDPTHFPHVPRISGQSQAAGVAAETPVPVRLGAPTGRVTVETGPAGFARRRTGGSLEEGLAAGRDLETNPFAVYASRSKEQWEALAAREFTDGVGQLADNTGDALLKPSSEVKASLAQELGVDPAAVTPKMLDEHLKDSNLVRVDMGRLGEVVTDKALAPELKKFADVATEPNAANHVYRMLDRWMTLWKGYATVPIPFGFGFHMRNSMGNVMLNWLADINPIDPAYAQAAKLQRAVSRGMKEGNAVKYLEGPQQELVRQALAHDVIGGGTFHYVDLPQDTVRGFRSTGRKVGEAVNPLDPNNLLIRSGRKFGQQIEENARLADFIAKYREFGNFEDAAGSVRRYLFDYSDLTKFEQNAMKRIIPFYTFARKNTPLWLGAAFKQPGKYSRLNEWRAAFIDAGGRQPTGVVPSYLEEQGAVPLPGQVPGSGSATTIFAPDLPHTAASEVITPFLRAGGQLAKGNIGEVPAELAPLQSQVGGGPLGLAKSWLEAYVAGKDFFSGKQFYPGEKTQLPGGVKIDARLLHVLEQALPLLPKVESALPQTKADQDKQFRRLVSIATGLQLYPLGEGTTRSELFRRNADVLQRLAKKRAKGENVPAQAPHRKKKSSSSGGVSLPGGGG